MKKGHIIGLVVIAVAVVIIVSTVGDASSYVSFQEAKEMADYGNQEKIHVIGELKKNQMGEVVGVEESENKLSFMFTMIDEENNEQRVFYNEPIPADFLRSEKVVVVGSHKNDFFLADKILLKCPSKYKETELSNI